MTTRSQTKMNPRAAFIRFRKAALLAFLLGACAIATARDKEKLVWNPTNLIGQNMPMGTKIGPKGEVWGFLNSPASSAPWSLVRSLDCGTSWSTVTVDVEPPVSGQSFVLDKEGCAWAYRAGGKGLSRFSPSGDLLTTTGLITSYWDMYKLNLISSPDGFLYMMRKDELKRISMQGEIRTTYPGLLEGEICDLAVDSRGALYAVAGSAYRSTDGGLTWDILFQGHLEMPYWVISVVADRYIFIEGPWVFRSLDGGTTWEELPHLEAGSMGRPVGLPDGSIAFSYRRLGLDPAERYGFFRSWDKGDTLQEFLPGIQKADFKAGAILRFDGSNIVYASIAFVEGKESQNGLYRMRFPAPPGPASSDKDWPKY